MNQKRANKKIRKSTDAKQQKRAELQNLYVTYQGQQLHGYVVDFPDYQKYGFIREFRREVDVYFHVNQTSGFDSQQPLTKDTHVSFRLVQQKDGQFAAHDVRPWTGTVHKGKLEQENDTPDAFLELIGVDPQDVANYGDSVVWEKTAVWLADQMKSAWYQRFMSATHQKQDVGVVHIGDEDYGHYLLFEDIAIQASRKMETLHPGFAKRLKANREKILQAMKKGRIETQSGLIRQHCETYEAVSKFFSRIPGDGIREVSAGAFGQGKRS